MLAKLRTKHNEINQPFQAEEKSSFAINSSKKRNQTNTLKILVA